MDKRKEFESIVSEYSEQLYFMIRRIVLTHEDANDVLQNTFLKAWNAYDTFNRGSKLSTWLTRIAINESLDQLRRNKHMASAAAEDLSVADSLMADDFFDGNETEAMLQEAIAQLPDVQRTVFQLRYFDELKYSDISQMLGTTEGSLKASYHIAVKKISEFFKLRD